MGTTESQRNDCLTRVYLFGWQLELDRQQQAGEEPDNDKAVAAGTSLERKVGKLLPDMTPPQARR